MGQVKKLTSNEFLLLMSDFQRETLNLSSLNTETREKAKKNIEYILENYMISKK